MPSAPPRRVAISAAENEQEDRRRLADGRPSVRAVALTDTVLSIGVGVRSNDPLLDRARSEGVPVLRRSTGGTGVLHAPGDLAWSVVLPRGDARIGPTLNSAYARLGRGAATWLAGHGRPAEWGPAPGRSTGCCLLSGRGEVLRVEGRVVGGAAQHRSATALLHHGVLPRAFDRDLHRAVFDFSSSEDVDRMVGWGELEIDVAPELAAATLAAAVRAALAIPESTEP